MRPGYLDPDGYRCGVCDRRCWSSAQLTACMRTHEPREDYEADGALARRQCAPISACPWPANTNPWLAWRRGWRQAEERMAA